jgi:hypothetical protein
MKKISRLVLTLAACAVSIAAFAQSPVGSWNGKLDLSGVHAKDAKEKQMVDQMKTMMASTVIKLTFKGDHTYSMAFSMGKGQGMTETGKWSQSGRTVTVTGKNGKPEQLTLNANGKQMVMVPPKGDKAPQGMKAIFTRG